MRSVKSLISHYFCRFVKAFKRNDVTTFLLHAETPTSIDPEKVPNNPSSIHPHPLVPFIFRGSAMSSSSRRRVDRSEREFLGSVSSRGAGDLSSSSPLTMSTEDLSFVGSRSLSPKRNLNATTTSGLGEQSNDAPART